MSVKDKIIFGLLALLLVGGAYFQWMSDDMKSRMDTLNQNDKDHLDTIDREFREDLRKLNIRFEGRGKHIRKAQEDIIANTNLINQTASELANKRDCRLHIHTSETRQEVADCHAKHGMYPIEYLDSIDYFQEGTVCAHCGWVTKKEMRILAKHEAHAVHCPVSNMKLATGGTLSYPAMLEAGVDVRLGTDGAASNNALDMRSEMKFASLIQKHEHWDSTILNPIETYEMAVRGSKDWVTWNLNDIRMRPIGKDGRRLLANLIYSSAECVDMWVDGIALRRNGNTITIDEKNVMVNLEHAIMDYYQNI